MAVASADLSLQIGIPVPVKIGVLIVHECPLFRVGLRSLLAQHSDFHVVGEATHLEDVLVLAGEKRPAIVLLDGGLTSTDPLDLVWQLRQLGVQGIMVFAPPVADEETLFHFLRYGATAYEDRYICGEDLIEKVRRMSLGEYLVTSDVLFAQAARHERLARIRRDAFLATTTNDAHLPLSEEERAILEQIAIGRTNAQAAQALGISPHTIKNQQAKLYRKLGVCNRTLAVVMALRKRWIAADG